MGEEQRAKFKDIYLHEPWSTTSPHNPTIHAQKHFENSTNFTRKKHFGSFVQSMNTPINKRNSDRSNSPNDNMYFEQKISIKDKGYFIKDRVHTKHKIHHTKSLSVFNGNSSVQKKCNR